MSLEMMGLDPVPLVHALSILLWQLRCLCQWRRLWCFCYNWNRFNWWRCSVCRVLTKRSQVQSWSTHRIILAPIILIYHFVSPSFKLTIKIIMVLCLCLAYSIHFSFNNIMTMQEPVGAIRRPSNSGSGDKEWPYLICCVDGRQLKINEVWTIGEDGITPEVYSTTHV